MVHRVIGQEQLALVTKPSARSSLDEMAALLDWSPVADLLKPIYAGEKGEAAWPPLAMFKALLLALFKALLLAVWYDLSDVKLAETLEDRASFRRFCGLVTRSLDRALFDAITSQLDAQGVVVKTGTLVDATVITSATMKDDEARWVGHRRKAPVHGYKAHVASDQDGGIVRAVEIAPANVNDGRMLEAVL